MFKFELTEQEANIILNALAAQPFGQVFQLVAKFQKQAQDQLKKQE